MNCCPGPVLLRYQSASEAPAGLVGAQIPGSYQQRFYSGGLRAFYILRICISGRFPGDSDTAGTRAML